MAILQERVAGLPIWGWGLIILGGIAVAVWVLPKLGLGGIGGQSGTTGQTTSGGITDPNIDPVTGVPYSIEEAINPSTGLPAYYGAGAGGTLTTTNAPPPPPVQANNPTPPLPLPPVLGTGTGGGFLRGDPIILRGTLPQGTVVGSNYWTGAAWVPTSTQSIAYQPTPLSTAVRRV